MNIETKKPRVHTIPNNMRGILESSLKKGYDFSVKHISGGIISATITSATDTYTLMWVRKGTSWKFLTATNAAGETYNASQARALVG